MGHKDPGAQTGESLTSVCVLGTRVLCFSTRVYSLCSTTAESAARLCVENAALNAPRTQLWALSSQCGCATPALIPSKKKSESRDFLHVIKVGHVSMCTCLFLCVFMPQSNSSGHIPRGETQHQPHGHGPSQKPDGHLWKRSHC